MKSICLTPMLATLFYCKKDKAPKQIVVAISMEETKGADISFDINSGQLTASAQNFYNFIGKPVDGNGFDCGCFWIVA